MARYESEGTWFEKNRPKTYPIARDYVLDMIYRRPTKKSIITRIDNALKMNSVRVNHSYNDVSYKDYVFLRDVLIVVRDELNAME